MQRMPAWFDITNLDSRGLQDMMKGRPFDPEGTQESVDYINRLVADEVAESGLPLSRVVVGGFSQVGVGGQGGGRGVGLGVEGWGEVR